MIPISQEIKRISTDVKGPLSIAGPHGEVYYQRFIDKWSYAYFVEFRSETLKNVKHLIEEKLPAEYGQPHVCMRQYISAGADL